MMNDSIYHHDIAFSLVEDFGRSFGVEHIRLAMHAAVPLSLTPELLNLIRLNFVSSADAAAETDLLLSPLCEEIAGQYYEMRSDVRQFLLEELFSANEYGYARVEAVCRFLHEYARRQLRQAEPLSASMRELYIAQRWDAAARIYPEAAAKAFAIEINRSLRGGDHESLVHIAALTNMLSEAMPSEHRVLFYAHAVTRMSSGDVEQAQEMLTMLGADAQPLQVADVSLPGLAELRTILGPDEVAAVVRSGEDEQTELETTVPLADEQAILITFSRTDASGFVEQLERDLKRSGFTIWIDRESDQTSPYVEDQREYLLEYCAAAIAVIGPSTHQDEFTQEAIAYFRTHSTRIIPVLIGSYDDVPSELLDLFYADFVRFEYELQLGRVIEALQLYLEGGILQSFPSENYIFVSRAYTDRDAAQSIQRDLEQRGITVWGDEHILPGQNWRIVIEEAIARCTAAIVLVSTNSRDQKGVEKNIASLQHLSKPMLPVVLDSFDSLFGELRTIQALDLRNYETDILKLVAWGEQITGRKPQKPVANRSSDRIFIAYRRPIAIVAEKLHLALSIAGSTVFIDVMNLSIGKDWVAQIRSEVEQCNLFIALCTPDSFESEFWVQELRWAYEMDKRIIPVIFESTEVIVDSLPIDLKFFAQLEHVRLRNETFDQDFNHLVQLIKNYSASDDEPKLSQDDFIIEHPNGTQITWRDTSILAFSAEGRFLRRLSGHTARINGVLILFDGRFLSWSNDTTLRLWSADGALLFVLADHEYAVIKVELIEDDRIKSRDAVDNEFVWQFDGDSLVQVTQNSNRDAEKSDRKIDNSFAKIAELNSPALQLIAHLIDSMHGSVTTINSRTIVEMITLNNSTHFSLQISSRMSGSIENISLLVHLMSINQFATKLHDCLFGELMAWNSLPESDAIFGLQNGTLVIRCDFQVPSGSQEEILDRYVIMRRNIMDAISALPDIMNTLLERCGESPE